MKANKTFFKPLNLLFIALFCFSMTSCYEIDGGNYSNEKVIGTWVYNTEECLTSFVFYANYTGDYHLVYYNESQHHHLTPFVYELESPLSGDVIFEATDGEGRHFHHFSINGNEMKIDGYGTFTKQ